MTINDKNFQLPSYNFHHTTSNTQHPTSNIQLKFINLHNFKKNAEIIFTFYQRRTSVSAFKKQKCSAWTVFFHEWGNWWQLCFRKTGWNSSTKKLSGNQRHFCFEPLYLNAWKLFWSWIRIRFNCLQFCRWTWKGRTHAFCEQKIRRSVLLYFSERFLSEN